MTEQRKYKMSSLISNELYIEITGVESPFANTFFVEYILDIKKAEYGCDVTVNYGRDGEIDARVIRSSNNYEDTVSAYKIAKKEGDKRIAEWEAENEGKDWYY